MTIDYPKRGLFLLFKLTYGWQCVMRVGQLIKFRLSSLSPSQIFRTKNVTAARPDPKEATCLVSERHACIITWLIKTLNDIQSPCPLTDDQKRTRCDDIGGRDTDQTAQAEPGRDGNGGTDNSSDGQRGFGTSQSPLSSETIEKVSISRKAATNRGDTRLVTSWSSSGIDLDAKRKTVMFRSCSFATAARASNSHWGPAGWSGCNMYWNWVERRGREEKRSKQK